MGNVLKPVAAIGGLFSKGFFKGSFSWAGLGVLVAERLLTPKQVIQGPRLLDLSVQAAEYGFRIPKIFGTERITGVIIWSGGLTEHTEDSSAGGGKGPPEPTVRDYHYTWNGAIIPCEGPIERIEEIRYNDKVIYAFDGTTHLGYSMTFDADTDTWSGTRVSTVDVSYIEETGEETAISDGSTLTIVLGTQNQEPHSMLEADFGVGKTSAYLDDVVIYFGNFDTGTNGLGTFSFRIKGTDGSLSDAVAYLWNEVGVTADQIDTSELDGLSIDGLPLTDRSSAGTWLQLLQSYFFFDICHIDAKETCLLRGRDTVTHIPDDDLRAFSLDSQGAGSKPDTNWSRADLTGIPAVSELQFQSVKRDYHPNMKSADWESEPQSLYNSLNAESTPIVLTEEAAQRIVDIRHHLRHIEQVTVSISVGSEYRWLAPADPFTINIRGTATRFRFVDAQRREYGVLKLRAVRDIAEVYDALEGEAGEGIDIPTLENNGAVYLGVIDAPCARDTDASSPGIYAYVSAPYGKSFRAHSVVLQDSADRGISGAATWITANSTLGTLHGTLGDFQPEGFASGSTVFDYTNTLTVDLVSGTLASASEDDVLSGSNAALLGSTVTGWECVQWTTATYDGPGSPTGMRRYVLSGLLRGRRGTENAISTHADGETFLLMSDSVKRVTLPPSYLNQAIHVVFTMNPPSSGTAADKTQVITGVGMMPIAPVDLETMSLRSDTNDLTIAGLRRSRLIDNFFLTGNSPDNATSDTDTIRIQILDAPGGAVLRTLSATADDDGLFSVTYTSGQQATDGITPGDPVDIKVQQNSTLVGYGFACEVTI